MAITQAETNLSISADDLAFIILKARAFDVQTAESDDDEGSNASDDDSMGVLGSHIDNPSEEELHSVISTLSVEQQIELVALVWVGRGDFDASEWGEALALAAGRREMPTSRYLRGIPLLGDYVEEGAAALGLNLTEAESEGLYRPGGPLDDEEPATDRE